jgi:hypothetical protein
MTIMSRSSRDLFGVVVLLWPSLILRFFDFISSKERITVSLIREENFVGEGVGVGVFGLVNAALRTKDFGDLK